MISVCYTRQHNDVRYSCFLLAVFLLEWTINDSTQLTNWVCLADNINSPAVTVSGMSMGPAGGVPGAQIINTTTSKPAMKADTRQFSELEFEAQTETE
jgi:hypothetical protein